MNHGTTIFTSMFIVFLVLKLTGLLEWSWWVVTMPVWLPCLIFIVRNTKIEWD